MNKYLIELPDSEEMGDLVMQMANFVHAEYRITMTLETESEQLARAVVGLTGQILRPEVNGVSLVENNWIENRLDQLFMPEIEQAVNVVAVGDGRGQAVAPTGEVEKRTGGMVLVDETREPDPEPPSPAAGKVCEFCGDPIGPRRKVCKKKECLSARQKRWNAAWKAKHKKSVAPASGVEVMKPIPGSSPPSIGRRSGEGGEEEETPGVEVPLAETGIVYYALSGEMAGANFDFEEMQRLLRTGWLAEGDRIQARPSGRFYEIRGGGLAQAEEIPEKEGIPEACPGAVEMTPAGL